MKYLLFNSEADAITRSDEAGDDKGLAYHKGHPDGTRYVWTWVVEAGGSPRACLCLGESEGSIKGADLLTPTETSALVDELPADWTHPPNPFE